MAERHFDLKQTKYLVIGGDGATWVKHSFDLLNLTQVPVLDRFHVARAVHSAFSKLTNSQVLLDALFSQPFETVKPQILGLINQTRGKQAVVLKRTLDYLENNQHALPDLAHRLPSDLKLATLAVQKPTSINLCGKECGDGVSPGRLMVLKPCLLF